MGGGTWWHMVAPPAGAAGCWVGGLLARRAAGAAGCSWAARGWATRGWVAAAEGAAPPAGQREGCCGGIGQRQGSGGQAGEERKSCSAEGSWCAALGWPWDGGGSLPCRHACVPPTCCPWLAPAADRDNFLGPEQAIALGLIDSVIA